MNFSLKKLFIGAGVSAMLLLMGVSNASAQAAKTKFKKERRIYLWDVTISTVGVAVERSAQRWEGLWEDRQDQRQNPYWNYATDGKNKNGQTYGYYRDLDVFEDTRAEMIQNIRNIGREDCELYVLAYRGNSPIVAVFHAEDSKQQSKDALIQQIENWDDLDGGATYTGKALAEALKYATAERNNRIYILTDGQANDEPDLLRQLQQWPHEPDGIATLVYVEVSEDAEDDDVRRQFDDDNPNTHLVKKGESYNEDVEMELTSNEAGIYINQKFDEEKSTVGEIYVGCLVTGGYGAEYIVCDFECEENPYVEFSCNDLKLQDGKFVLPYRLKLKSQEEYYEALKNQVTRVRLTCKVAKSCTRKVYMRGEDVVEVDLIVKPEPRVVLSISAKK